MTAAIQVHKLAKSFSRGSPPVTWKNLLTGGWKRVPRETLWVLQDVSFELAAGEMLGVVGANGAGKSTLLRLLGGIGSPTRGTIEVRGRMGSLLELGGGFQGDLTGRENAVMAAVVAGLLKLQATERLPEIIRFAELEEFIDAPVRTYSTGMMMRLAFAVAVHTDPEVLLVDEFLSVGDLAFQAKCNARIAALREQGCAVVLVSHGMEQIRDLCDRALWLRRGQVAAYGSTESVALAYEQEMHEETKRRTPNAPPRRASSGRELRIRESRFGSLEMEIVSVQLEPGATLITGQPLSIAVHYHSDIPLKAPIFVVSISRPDGEVCAEINSEQTGALLERIQGSGTVCLNLERLDLSPGSYFVDVGVFEAKWSHAYDYHWHVYPLTMEGGPATRSPLAPPARWSLPRKAAGTMASDLAGLLRRPA